MYAVDDMIRRYTADRDGITMHSMQQIVCVCCVMMMECVGIITCALYENYESYIEITHKLKFGYASIMYL